VLADKYGSDALRYYLMRDIGRGKDADFLKSDSSNATMPISQLAGQFTEPNAQHGGKVSPWAVEIVRRMKHRRATKEFGIP